MNDDPKIGKDVIESLTLGMYEDCRFIYREYIQNSGGFYQFHFLFLA